VKDPQFDPQPLIDPLNMESADAAGTRSATRARRRVARKAFAFVIFLSLSLSFFNNRFAIGLVLHF
jgi:hypothetical protein